jgi:hypothetical protein
VSKLRGSLLEREDKVLKGGTNFLEKKVWDMTDNGLVKKNKDNENQFVMNKMMSQSPSN